MVNLREAWLPKHSIFLWSFPPNISWLCLKNRVSPNFMIDSYIISLISPEQVAIPVSPHVMVDSHRISPATNGHILVANPQVACAPAAGCGHLDQTPCTSTWRRIWGCWGGWMVPVLGKVEKEVWKVGDGPWLMKEVCWRAIDGQKWCKFPQKFVILLTWRFLWHPEGVYFVRLLRVGFIFWREATWICLQRGVPHNFAIFMGKGMINHQLQGVFPTFGDSLIYWGHFSR